MITFYDLDSALEGRAHNPNCWKTRFTLNYKGLPYKTVWVEYIDIQALGKKLGATPVVKNPIDGELMHTLPMIHDDTTGAIVTDSILIAEYLDKTYPDTPALFPAGTHALQAAFVVALMSTLSVSFFRFAAPTLPKVVNEASREYISRRRAQQMGVASLEDLIPSPEIRDAEWAKVKDSFGVIDGWMKKEDVWLMGDVPSFADFVFAGFLYAFKGPLAESAEWKDVMSWHDGRWARLVENMQKYSTIQ